jgi:NADH dehydrogenase FAD-containing subunit
MKRKRIIVVGSSFAGFTAAVDLHEQLGAEHDVVVISKSDEFLFMPSLIWVAFGLRSGEDITFAVRPALEKQGVRFQHDEVTRLDLERRVVSTRAGHERYDHLVIATGSKPNYAAIPGLGPRGYTQSIMSLAGAERARTEFEKFCARPGPVVIGSVQGASCHIAAHEFLFSMACQLRSRGLESRAPMTYVTAEPFIQDFGLSHRLKGAEIIERFADKLGIRIITGGSIQQITPTEVVLADGGRLPFAYAMLVPPTLGVAAVRACDRITNAFGFVRVNSFGQTDAYPEVFAAGDAAAGADHLSPEEMATIVAGNIAAQIRGGTMSRLPAARTREAASAGPSPADAIP